MFGCEDLAIAAAVLGLSLGAATRATDDITANGLRVVKHSGPTSSDSLDRLRSRRDHIR
jgi:hypothetical protein